VITDQNGNPVFAFTFNDFNRNDVGKTAVVATIPVQDYTNGHGLDVNLGSAEGDVTQIQVPALSALNLGVSEIRLGDLLANQAAEGRIGNALEEITSARAAIGAELAATNYAATDASEQVLEQTASESSIRDLNVGRAATDYTRRQLLVSIGSSVLSQMEIDTKQLTAILVTALVA
jgi:flagellin-like hook-associated protein FlgL